MVLATIGESIVKCARCARFQSQGSEVKNKASSIQSFFYRANSDITQLSSSYPMQLGCECVPMQMRFVSGLFLLPFANPVVRRRYFQLSFSYLGRAKRSCRISPDFLTTPMGLMRTYERENHSRSMARKRTTASRGVRGYRQNSIKF